jgi:hypothetical protein
VKEAETAENSSLLEEGLVVLASRGQSASSEQQQPPTKIKVTNQPLHFSVMFLSSMVFF